MKKIILLLCLIGGVLPGWGQDSLSPSLRVSTTTEAPQSSIDLLQKSLQSSGAQVVGTADSATKTPDKNAKKQENSSEKQSSSPSATSVEKRTEPAAAPAKPEEASSAVKQNSPVVPSPKTPSAPKSAPASGKPAPATLDMPLAIGGNVQTVQTTVEPVKTKPALAPRRPLSGRKPQPAAGQTPGKKPAVTPAEQAIETDNALLPDAAKPPENETPGVTEEEEEAAADAELEYAIKMMQESKAKAEAAARPIPPPAAQNRPNKVPIPNRKFNPNAFRPGVEWLYSKSTHFDIYTQKRTAGVPSSNMAMNFEASYQTLRRFIPWMMSGRVRVFVYQDHASYLRYEPNAKAWTRAVAYPTRGEIVIYDEPGKVQELKEVFTHELTHIFTQQFFDSHKTGRIMTPLWLDEGLAVFMEDQHNGKGGVWAHDFKTLNFQRSPEEVRPGFASSSMFGRSSGKKFMAPKKGNPIFFIPFEKFMEDNSLQGAEGSGHLQDWYFQAYTMVRFLLNPAGGSSPSNRMQFEQFTRLIAQGEAVRNPSTGFLVKDSRGKTVYEPYSVEKALGRAYRYNTAENFEDAFWRWADR